MLILLSPSKTLDFKVGINNIQPSMPRFLEKSKQLASILKKLNVHEIKNLMGISQQLAELNFERFRQWDASLHTSQGKTALFVFKGDVYEGFHATPFPQSAYMEAEKRLRILSGLYGVLRPFDLILPYRLEMGTKLKNPEGNYLYAFWSDDVTRLISEDLRDARTDIVLNLASNEYFKVVNCKKLQATIITPEFRDYQNGSYKMISFFAKRARGLMAAWVLRNGITEPSRLIEFSEEGYAYNDLLSEPRKPVFTR